MSGGQYREDDAVDNWGEYIEERLTTGTQADRLEEQSRTLEQEMAELEALRQERSGPQPRADIDALIEQAELRIERMKLRQGAERAVTPGSQVDLEQTPPEAEARAQVTDQIDRQTGYGNVKR
jgi:hypothetical protein